MKVPFELHNGAWTINWDALERAITPRTKLFYLCNPHNPLARVWRREELVRLADFCVRHDLVLCSDEIHCDLILDPALKHIPTALLSPEIAARTITLMAPSKTYNVPGLGTSFAITAYFVIIAVISLVSILLLPEPQLIPKNTAAQKAS